MPSPTAIRRQTGSFILEAMISLMLFAVALLGLMALSVQGLNQVGQSKARNDASYIVGELLSEMWVSANVNLTTWTTRLQTAIPGATGSVYLATCQCSPNTAATTCTDSVGGTTSPASGTIAVANPQAVTVCVSWPDRKDASYPRLYQASSMITRN
ncbi:MAG: hypothetical protein M0Q22_10535 [Sulfuritalea sp.]|jgi:type IV pilus assembly protein PilV|nr:hypothetical protein [Sulfuritalea sp.]